jgi:hypothetical protein
MYQRRITHWELEKKSHALEMRAILHLARQREATGQKSTFWIRGRKIDIEEVYRYFKRRGKDPNKLDVQRSPIPSSIRVETPRPSDITIHDAAEFNFSDRPSKTAVSVPPVEDYATADVLTTPGL